MKNWKHLLLATLFIAVSFSCNRHKKQPVPYFSFDVTVNLNLPSYVSLQGVGGWAYIDGLGSKGVVVYRKSYEQFIAFDRHSPAEEGFNCDKGLEIDKDNFLILNDPCSDAQFSLYDGSVLSGNSDWGLRSYLTQYDGNTSLRIYNP